MEPAARRIDERTVNIGAACFTAETLAPIMADPKTNNSHLTFRLDDVVESDGQIGYVTQCPGGTITAYENRVASSAWPCAF